MRDTFLPFCSTTDAGNTAFEGARIPDEGLPEPEGFVARHGGDDR